MWHTSDVRHVSLPLVCVVVSACLAGCPDEPLGELNPDIAVDPAALDFGTVQPGVSHDDVVDVGNRGTGTLTVRGVRVEPDDTGFSVLAFPDKVAPGQAEGISVSLLVARAGDVAGADLVIDSDDDDTPELRVPLTAEGGVAKLLISPDPIAFGRVSEGPGDEQVVTLTNDGLDDLVINGAAFVDNVGFVVDASALPVNLGPREVALVTVSLQPTAALIAALPEPRLVDELVFDTSIGERGVNVSADVNLAPVVVNVERDSRRSVVKVGINDPVVADGSETADPEGDAFTFFWSVPVRPNGSIAAVIGQGQPQARVTADVVGSYVVRLRATDVHGAFGEADLQLAPRDLAAVLTWGPAGSAACLAFSDEQCDAMTPQERAQNCCGHSDLDVHLIAPTGVLGDYGACPGTCADEEFCAEESDAHVDTCRQTGLDCSFANRFPEWGAVGRGDDPRLDIDDVSGEGPEVISLNEPVDGQYRVVVHYCLDRNDEPSQATITFFDQGEVFAVAGPQTITEGEAWLAAVLVRENGTWTPTFLASWSISIPMWPPVRIRFSARRIPCSIPISSTPMRLRVSLMRASGPRVVIGGKP